jgi:tetratricopeptide (TPR) repeat protein
LALMDHPNIAKVFDAGATETGRPYFVMELVRGEPISTYCDGAQFSIAERVELFTQVCRAVQHAHTKGVIHRDIKPSNVLVSTVDGRPMVKVIDFGIAKATDSRLTEKTLFTEFKQFIGTPEYMSPEQAAGSLDLDTRTDVYALGVLLYELLTGATPFDGKELRSAAYAEMQRIIREVDPPAPSTRLSRSRETLPGIAALRRTAPARLSAIIRGELDWIVMRALDKDRARRYDTAGDLAADVERYLAGKPIEAASAGALYRLRKALRRNRLAVATGAIVAVALLVGTGIALWQARIASTERDAATASATEAEDARKESDLRRKETEQVAEFEAARLKAIDPPAMGDRLLSDLLENARAGMKRRAVPDEEIDRRAAQLGELLEDVNTTDLALSTLDQNIFEGAIKAVDEQFKEQPLVAARLLNTLGGIMLDLGLLDRAAEPIERAVRIRRDVVGDAHVDTLLAISDLGLLRLHQSRLLEAEELFREAMNGLESARGSDDPETLNATNNVGMALLMQGKLAEAEPVLRSLLATYTRISGPEDPISLMAANNVGGVLMELDRPAEAEPFFSTVLEQYRRIEGPDHEYTLMSMSNLAFSRERQGRIADAEPLYREAMERSRRTLGEEHRNTLMFKSNLGFLLCSLGRLEEAEALTMEVLQTRRRLVGESHADTLQSLHNAAVLMEAKGDVAAAERMLREAVQGRIALNGPGHWSVTQSRTELAELFVQQGRFKEAEAALLDAQREVAATKGVARDKQVQRVQALVAHYEAWEAAEPGQGHAAQAQRWRDAPAKPAR